MKGWWFFKEYWIFDVYATVITLIVAYPLGLLAAPPEHPLIAKFALGAWLGGVFVAPLPAVIIEDATRRYRLKRQRKAAEQRWQRVLDGR